MEKSLSALFATVSSMNGMCRSCEQSLRIREIGTLSGTLKHHVVMDAVKDFLQKPGRGIGLARWYGPFNRALHIRSGDS